jgi:hypothetical protein
VGGVSGKIDRQAYSIAEGSAAGAIDADSSSFESISGAAEADRRRVSLFHYAPAALVLIAVIVDKGQFADPDLWGHLRSGQAILAHGHLIRADPYSYSAPGHLWRNHEWLTEIIMASLYNAFGVIALKLWKFVCAAATVVFVAIGLAETDAEPDVQLCTLILAALPMMPMFEFRPQVFTFALFAAVLAIIARHNYRGAAPLWLMPPILALWANLHGGFIMGIAALGIYTAVIGVEDLAAGRGLARALRLGMSTLASILATLITPYGIGTWSTVTRALGNPITRRVVRDWLPLLSDMRLQATKSYTGEVFYLIAIALMAAAAVGFLLSPSWRDLPLAAIAMVMAAAAFMAARNMPLTVIACALPVARHASVLKRRYAAKNRAVARAPAAHNRFAAAACLTAAAGLAIGSGVFSPRMPTDEHYPAEALAFMRAHHIHGNLLDDFNWGEYLIWHAPDCKLFIDGRYDTAYPMRVIRDYLKFYFDGRDASRVLASYPHELALIPPGAGAFRLLEHTPGWKLIYHDKYSALFARANSPAAQIPGIPVRGSVASAPQYFP